MRKDQDLITSGPYGWMRNPLYAGTLVAALGFVTAASAPWLAFAFGVAFFLIYGPVMQNEQQHLRELFPGYEEYARRVPLLWPRRPAGRSPRRFDRALYMRNQEYKAAGAYVLVAAFLIWKTTLP